MALLYKQTERTRNPVENTPLPPATCQHRSTAVLRDRCSHRTLVARMQPHSQSSPQHPIPFRNSVHHQELDQSNRLFHVTVLHNTSSVKDKRTEVSRHELATNILMTSFALSACTLCGVCEPLMETTLETEQVCTASRSSKIHSPRLVAHL
jgi:hypothetical protein